MERKSSPERSSPDSTKDTGTVRTIIANDDDNSKMATMVAHSNPQNMPGPVGGVNKRYRPAPAKTFQCRGYGDCRMVFSRSEHLARHIRKHTGERPFMCHCGKQFSRLDNLRQHAQTVHADKQDQNERMMRDLTSLHASMAAANKVTNPRGGRRSSNSTNQPAVPSSPHAPTNNGHASASPNSHPHSNGLDDPTLMIKEEDLGLSIHHHRADTNAGYDTDHNALLFQHTPTWHVQSPADLEPRTHSPNNRQPHQAFQAQQHNSQPYLSFTPTLTFSLPSDPPRSRPSTSSGAGLGGTADERSLPPLSAIIPTADNPHQQSLQQFQQQQLQHHQLQQQGYVPPHLRPRPGTGSGRPGSSSASTFYLSGPSSKVSSSYYGVPTQSLHFGRGYSDLHGGYDTDITAGASVSPSSPHAPGGGAQETSPFYFHPDDSQSASTHNTGASPSNGNIRSPPVPRSTSPVVQASGPSHATNSRKRAFGGPDGPFDDLGAYNHPPPPPPSLNSGMSQHHQQQPHSNNGVGMSQSHPQNSHIDYDYGTDSRPQSRRLSVMELCNENGMDPGAAQAAVFGISMGIHGALAGIGVGVSGMSGGMGVNGVGGFATMGDGPEGRPTTASGLGIVSSAGALSLFDHRHRGSRSPPDPTVDGLSTGLERRQRASPVGSVASHGSNPTRRESGDGSIVMSVGGITGKLSPPSRRVTPAGGGVYASSAGSGSSGPHSPPDGYQHQQHQQRSQHQHQNQQGHLISQQPPTYSHQHHHQQHPHQQFVSPTHSPYPPQFSVNVGGMGVLNINTTANAVYPQSPTFSTTTSSSAVSTPSMAFAPMPAHQGYVPQAQVQIRHGSGIGRRSSMSPSEDGYGFAPQQQQRYVGGHQHQQGGYEHHQL